MALLVLLDALFGFVSRGGMGWTSTYICRWDGYWLPACGALEQAADGLVGECSHGSGSTAVISEVIDEKRELESTK